MVILRFAMKKPRDDSYLGNDRENLNKRIPAKKSFFQRQFQKSPWSLTSESVLSIIVVCWF